MAFENKGAMAATVVVAASDSLNKAAANYVCDGVDDDVQINAALTVAALTTGHVVLSEGTFNISNPVIFPASDLILEGCGLATYINGDGLADNEHCIQIDALGFCVIYRLRLSTTQGGGLNRHCIYVNDMLGGLTIKEVFIDSSDADGIRFEGLGANNVDINGCFIQNCDGKGIYFNMDPAAGNWDISIEGNYIYNCGDHLIHFGTCTGYSDCFISNNLIDTSVAAGIYLEEFYDGVVSGNIIMSTDNGIVITGIGIRNVVANNVLTSLTDIGMNIASAFNLIIGNNINYTDGHGIYITGEDCLVADNVILYQGVATPGTYHGILIQADRATISDNYIAGSGAETEDGIHIADGFGDCKIDGNKIYDVMGSGIALEANNLENLIINNSTYFCDDYGIELTAATCDSNRVLNNHFSGNVTGQFLDNGVDTRVHELFVPVPNPSTNIGAHPAEQLTDGLDVVSRFNLKIPEDFQELVTCQALVVPGGTGNMRRSVSCEWGKVGTDVYNQDSGAIAAGQVAVTVDVLELIDIAAALVGTVSGVPVPVNNAVGVVFTREASNVNDTVDADCYLLGLRLRYV